MISKTCHPVELWAWTLRNSTLSFLLVLCWGAAPAIAQDYPAPREMSLPAAQFVPPDPGPLQQTLSNGLVAYLVRDDLVPLVEYSALINAGSADGAGGAAYAAALESGPSALSANDFAETLHRMAARFEVSQSHTETRIVLEVPVEDSKSGLELFAALLEQPRFGASSSAGASKVEEASGESGPVLYEGSLDAAVDLLEQAIYSGHAYRGSFGEGTPATGPEFSARLVHPGNVVLAVSGDLEVAEMRRDLETALGSWGSGDDEGSFAEPVTLPAPQPPQQRRVLLYPADKLQGWIAIGHELPPLSPEDEAAVMVMNYVLGGGHFDTRLFRETRDRRGLTNDDSGFPVQTFRGPGLYSFRTYGRPQAVRLLIHLTLQEINRIRQEPVTEEELFVAEGALADGDFSLWFRNGSAVAETYAREWLRDGAHGRAASWPQRIRAVTADQVLAAARRYLQPDRMQIVVVGPIDQIRSSPAMENEPTLDRFGEVTQPQR